MIMIHEYAKWFFYDVQKEKNPAVDRGNSVYNI